MITPLNQGVNLRPWRKENRQKQQKKFIQLSFAALIFSLLTSLILWQSTTASITKIQQENNFIKQHLTQLNVEIKEVASLREKRQLLLKHIGIIQKLQNNQPVAVELMQQLTSSMNDDVFLTKLNRSENQLILEGQANTSQAIATWMRSLNTQPRYAEVILRSITTSSKTSLTYFDVLIPLQEPVK